MPVRSSSELAPSRCISILSNIETAATTSKATRVVMGSIKALKVATKYPRDLRAALRTGRTRPNERPIGRISIAITSAALRRTRDFFIQFSISISAASLRIQHPPPRWQRTYRRHIHVLRGNLSGYFEGSLTESQLNRGTNRNRMDYFFHRFVYLRSLLPPTLD